MTEIIVSNQFKKDLKLLAKRNYNLDALDEVVTKLSQHIPLGKKHKDHPLTGEYIGFRECHVKPDWLLVYCFDDEELELLLFRTGSHADLFD